MFLHLFFQSSGHFTRSSWCPLFPFPVTLRYLLCLSERMFQSHQRSTEKKIPGKSQLLHFLFTEKIFLFFLIELFDFFLTYSSTNKSWYRPDTLSECSAMFIKLCIAFSAANKTTIFFPRKFSSCNFQICSWSRCFSRHLLSFYSFFHYSFARTFLCYFSHRFSYAAPASSVSTVVLHPSDIPSLLTWLLLKIAADVFTASTLLLPSSLFLNLIYVFSFLIGI
jgi:hypothetical protein